MRIKILGCCTVLIICFEEGGKEGGGLEADGKRMAYNNNIRVTTTNNNTTHTRTHAHAPVMTALLPKAGTRFSYHTNHKQAAPDQSNSSQVRSERCVLGTACFLALFCARYSEQRLGTIRCISANTHSLGPGGQKAWPVGIWRSPMGV